MVQIHDILGPPDPLMSLLNGSREYASGFQNSARDFDALLSFASIGEDIDAPNASSGSYVYRIRGAICHRFGPIGPEAGVAPRYAQINLFDTSEATGPRDAQALSQVRIAIIADLRGIMGACIPFPILPMDCAARMRKAGHENLRLILRADDAWGR